MESPSHRVTDRGQGCPRPQDENIIDLPKRRLNFHTKSFWKGSLRGNLLSRRFPLKVLLAFESFDLFAIEFDAGAFLNEAEMSLVFGVNKGDRLTRASGAAGAADAVDIIHG